jgi:signal transduction histidine kinase
MPHDVPTTEVSVSELLGSRRGDILRHLEHRLRATGSSLGKDPAVLPACIERADALLTATLMELDSTRPARRPDPGAGRTDPAVRAEGADHADPGDGDPGDAGPGDAGPGVPPGGAGLLMDVVLKELLHVVVEQPELMPEVSAALIVLHRNLASQGQPPGDSYDAYIVRSAEDARRRERRQLAREVHDELGHELSIAMRQLELSELYGPVDPQAAVARIGGAREHLASALGIVRRMIAEFSERPSVDLEKEIVSFADMAGALRTTVHVRVTGNQLLIPGGHRHELFLIVREALLNVFAHAQARTATVMIDITSEAITATVADDGKGMTTAEAGGTRRRGFGLTSMRERAGSLGGTVTVAGSSAGTRVDIWLPLP